MKSLGPRLRGDDELLSPGYVKLNKDTHGKAQTSPPQIHA
jgi:hypothetical protein